MPARASRAPIAVLLWPLALLSSPFVVVLLLLVLVGGSGGDGVDAPSQWTIEEGGLTLQRDLVVGDDEDFYFGGIPDMTVAGDGRIFVLDWEVPEIKVVGPEGDLLRTIGREGQGPGELQAPRFGDVTRMDSLYVFDSRSERISVFTTGGRFARSVGVEHQPFDMFAAQHGQPGFVTSYDNTRPGAEEVGDQIVRVLDASGTVVDTVLTAPAREMQPVQESVSAPVPFGHGPHVAIGPEGRIHFGRSDSLRATSYGLDGTAGRTVRIPFELVPASEDDVEQQVERYPSSFRAKLESAARSTKPAFRQLLVDDQGRYWFGRPTADPDSTAWWVAWPDERRVVTATLPSEVEVVVVKDGHAYGRTTTENGAPALVRYRVHVSD